MKPIKVYIAGSLIGVLTIVSCENFLSVDQKGIYTEENYFRFLSV